MSPVIIEEFADFEQGGYASEEEAIEAIRVLSITPPKKRPRAFTRQVVTENSLTYVRSNANLEPIFVIDLAHPVDAAWHWFD